MVLDEFIFTINFDQGHIKVKGNPHLGSWVLNLESDVVSFRVKSVALALACSKGVLGLLDTCCGCIVDESSDVSTESTHFSHMIFNDASDYIQVCLVC